MPENIVIAVIYFAMIAGLVGKSRVLNKDFAQMKLLTTNEATRKIVTEIKSGLKLSMK